MKRYCIPGAKLQDLEEAADTVSDQADRGTLYVLHAGTNDVQSSRTKEILDNYR